jgi:serine/threonine protein kinase
MTSTKSRLSATFAGIFGCRTDPKDKEEIPDELKPLPAFLTTPIYETPRDRHSFPSGRSAPPSPTIMRTVLDEKKKRHLTPDIDKNDILKRGSKTIQSRSSSEGHNWRYIQGKKLGRGNTSEVFIVETLEGSPQVGKFALKRMVVRDEEEKKRLLKEAQILDKLQHPNIVTFVDVFAESRSGHQTINILEELCDMDLALVLKSSDVAPSLLLEWTLTLAKVLQYIHESHALHRDLKPGNILFKRIIDPETNNQKLVLKLCDFGYAKSIENSSARTLVGSEKYIAPEISKQIEESLKKTTSREPSQAYSSAVDIWSLGVLIYQFVKKCSMERLPDFTERLIRDENWVQGSLKEHIDQPNTILGKLSIVCVQCLRLEPIERPTAQDVVNLLNS